MLNKWEPLICAAQWCLFSCFLLLSCISIYVLCPHLPTQNIEKTRSICSSNTSQKGYSILESAHFTTKLFCDSSTKLIIHILNPTEDCPQWSHTLRWSTYTYMYVKLKQIMIQNYISNLIFSSLFFYSIPPSLFFGCWVVKLGPHTYESHVLPLSYTPSFHIPTSVKIADANLR